MDVLQEELPEPEQYQQFDAPRAAPITQLNEPVLATIRRDLLLIVLKVRLVLDYSADPKTKYETLRNWDLWGPMILVLLMSVLSSFSKTDSSAETNFTTIFMVYVLGCLVITLNARLLRVGLSFPETVSILGYCTCPIVALAYLLALFSLTGVGLLALRVAASGLVTGYSILCASRCLSASVPADKVLMAGYPVVIMYLMLSLLLFSL
jgi:hypothetical protein